MNSIKQHELRADWVDDEHGPAVMLTQSDDGYCEPQTILVHPWQLRATCEHFGILPTGDEQARRTIATLGRRLQVLADRISYLREYVAVHSDHDHADLQAEMTMLTALDDLAGEWVKEAAEAVASGPVQNAPEAPKERRNELAQVATPSRAKKRPEPQPDLI